MSVWQQRFGVISKPAEFVTNCFRPAFRLKERGQGTFLLPGAAFGQRGEEHVGMAWLSLKEQGDRRELESCGRHPEKASKPIWDNIGTLLKTHLPTVSRLRVIPYTFSILAVRWTVCERAPKDCGSTDWSSGQPGGSSCGVLPWTSRSRAALGRVDRQKFRPGHHRVHGFQRSVHSPSCMVSVAAYAAWYPYFRGLAFIGDPGVASSQLVV
jgi:hypothetical protein